MEGAERSLPWRWLPKKRARDMMDVFFEDGDRVCCYSVKQLPLENVEEEDGCRRLPEFPCCIAGCTENFNTILGYESHYNSVHRHTCSQCRRTFPSNHLLEIHLQESHDPLFQIHTGDKFLCLVHGCDIKFSSMESRRNHLINIHKYPSNYRFDRSRQKKPIYSESNLTESMEVSQPERETTTQESGSHRIFSHKVPKSICFGQGSARSFHRPRNPRRGKHWHQSVSDMETTVHIENVDMNQLKEALA